MSTEKISYLDGLRGWAAFTVFIAHYIQMFYPAVFSVNATIVHNSIETTFPKTVFNVVINAQFAVTIFFVLSAYVLSFKFFKYGNPEIITTSAIKRYFRLVIPVVAIHLIIYLLFQFNAFTNYGFIIPYIGEGGFLNRYEDQAHLLTLLKLGLYDVFFNYDKSYNAVLWTMTYELFGSFLVFSFLAVFGNVKQRYVVYGVLLFVFKSSYYLAFILGMILSDLVNRKHINLVGAHKKFASLGLFLLGLFFGSYPYVGVQDTIYQYLFIPYINIDYSIFWHSIGAFLLLASVMLSSTLQRLYSLPIIEYLGKISFSLYLIHVIILVSFSSAIFKLMVTNFSYNVSVLLTFIPTFLLVMVTANFLYKYVDQPAMKFASYVHKEYFSEKNIDQQRMDQVA